MHSKREFCDAIDRAALHDVSLDCEFAGLGDGASRLPDETTQEFVVECEERTNANVRAKVRHLFSVIRRQYGLTTVRYRALAKNTAQFVTLFALSRPWMARQKQNRAVVWVRL